MIKYTPESLISIWQSIFNRKGGIGETTNYFENQSLSIQTTIQNKIEFNQNEIPFILDFKNNENWLLLTSERIIRYFSNQQTIIDNTMIKDIMPTQIGKVKKKGMNELKIILRGNRQEILNVENGKPFFGVWNVILNIIERNKN